MKAFAKNMEEKMMSEALKSQNYPKGEKRHIGRNIILSIIVTLILALIAARIYAPIWIKDHVNKVLDDIPGYSGSVEDIDLALYRGAYVIHGLKIFKDGKDIPIPFIDFPRSDLSLQWGALFRGEIVGDVTLNNPKINFAVGRSGQTSQTGTTTDWTKPIQELMPLDINWVEIDNGTITYQDFSAREKVDLSIYNLNARATNLRNVEDKNAPLPSTLTARAVSVGKGQLALDGRMNILRPIPDFDMKAKLESVNLPALNDYARSAAGIDFTTGTLNIYSDLKVKDGNLSGFIKPLATNITLIDLEKDSSPIGVIWESIVSVVLEVFQNQPKDQFGTQIQLEGKIDNPETNFWQTLGGILRNAFVKAYSNTVKPE
jgi:hypothetical protein